MTAIEAYNVIHQLARAAPVNGDVGDTRDQALALLKELIEGQDKPKPKRP